MGLWGLVREGRNSSVGVPTYEEVLDVVLREHLRAVDDAVEVAVEELRDDVCVHEPRPGRAHAAVGHEDEVVVPAEEAQQLELAQDALRVRQVAQRLRDLLDRDAAPRRLVDGGRDAAVGAGADVLEARVARVDVEGLRGKGGGKKLRGWNPSRIALPRGETRIFLPASNAPPSRSKGTARRLA